MPRKGHYPSIRNGKKICIKCYAEKPTSEFYTTGRGTLASICKVCHNVRCSERRGVADPGKYIPLHNIRVAIIELQNRLGASEADRRCGFWRGKTSRLLNHPPRFVQRKTARAIIEALVAVRQENIVRHRDSIRRGAHSRGEKEKTPTTQKHLYRPHGDNNALNRQRWREANREKERERDRERKRRKRAA